MIKIWFIILFIFFAISVLTLTYIQIRVARNYGWSALRKRPFFQTYWGELSVLERILLLPGLAMFFIALIIGALFSVVK